MSGSDHHERGDLDVLLRELGEEDLAAPPPEVALAAVRVFRYRLIAVLAVVTAIAVTAPAVVRALQSAPAGTAYARLAADPDVFRVEYIDHRATGDEHVTLWDVVCDHTSSDLPDGGSRSTATGTCYVRVLAWSDDPDTSAWVAGISVHGVHGDGSGFGLGNEQANASVHEWVVPVPASVVFDTAAELHVAVDFTGRHSGQRTSRTVTFPLLPFS